MPSCPDLGLTEARNTQWEVLGEPPIVVKSSLELQTNAYSKIDRLTGERVVGAEVHIDRHGPVWVRDCARPNLGHTVVESFDSVIAFQRLGVERLTTA